MASAIIHMATAKRIKEKLNLNVNEKEYYLGTITPDISKEINRPRQETHFMESGRINIEKFLNKYKKYLNNSFELGYFIHLYTDLLWKDNVINKIIKNKSVVLLDGTNVEVNEKKFEEIMYNDYSNMNILLLEEYDMDLSLFYEEFEYPVINIEEVPNNFLNIIVNKMGIISANSKLDKNYLFDISLIKEFIEKTADECSELLIKLEKDFYNKK